jgi:5-methylcytosine-specific restriction endonuclease McrA
MAKRKPWTAAKYRKECIELAKTIAKTRDGYQCQRCDRTDGKMDGSHVKESSTCGGDLATDTMNIKCLCAQCHIWWHACPDESGAWWRENFPVRAKYLDEKKAEYERNRNWGTLGILWWRQRHEDLKREMAELS